MIFPRNALGKARQEKIFARPIERIVEATVRSSLVPLSGWSAQAFAIFAGEFFARRCTRPENQFSAPSQFNAGPDLGSRRDVENRQKDFAEDFLNRNGAAP